MLITNQIVETLRFTKRKWQTQGYISSMINAVNYYQLPSLKYIHLSFKLVSKDRFIVLAYYVLFKYFFNLAPKIQLIRKKNSGVILPIEIRLVLYRRNISKFFTSFVYPYNRESVEERRVFISSPSYSGQECSLTLNNFFLLNLFMDVLLLYKNDGLFLGTYEKLYLKFGFLSKTNLWNYFYLNFMLNPFGVPDEI